VGTWRQLRLLLELLGAAMTASAPAEETRLRIDLRDCAGYVVTEVDRSLTDLEAAIELGAPARALSFEKKSRPLLARARPVLARLAAGP